MIWRERRDSLKSLKYAIKRQTVVKASSIYFQSINMISCLLLLTGWAPVSDSLEWCTSFTWKSLKLWNPFPFATQTDWNSIFPRKSTKAFSNELIQPGKGVAMKASSRCTMATNKNRLHTHTHTRTPIMRMVTRTRCVYSEVLPGGGAGRWKCKFNFPTEWDVFFFLDFVASNRNRVWRLDRLGPGRPIAPVPIPSHSQ